MITVHTIHRSQQEWHELVSQFHDVSLMQLWEYGYVKERMQGWRVVHHVFHDAGRIVGIAQGVMKRLPFLRGGMLWMNRGPLWRRRDGMSDPQQLERLLIALRDHWTARGVYLRIAPPVTDDALTPRRLCALGMEPRLGSAWTSAIVDCTRTENDLRAALDKKWRNCLTRAEQLGLVYVTGDDPLLFDRFEDDYRSFLREKSYATPITPAFVRALNDALPLRRRLRVHTATHGGVHCGSILTAEYHGTAEYLIGAVNAAGKRMNAGQFLLWHALCSARTRGANRFDIGGMHPVQTPRGIYHFKAGLAGTPYALVGEADVARGFLPRLTRRVVALVV